MSRFVYLSGAGVGQGKTEEWFVAKDKAEAAVRDSGMTWTILRPSWVYGPRDRSLNRFALFARAPAVRAAHRLGHQRRSGRSTSTTSRRPSCSRSSSPAADNQVFEIGGPQLLSMRQIVRTMLEVMGKRRLVLPAPAARGQARRCAALPAAGAAAVAAGGRLRQRRRRRRQPGAARPPRLPPASARRRHLLPRSLTLIRPGRAAAGSAAGPAESLDRARRAGRGAAQTGRTWSAWGPFWPWVTSNSTRWPSSRLR